MSDRVRAMLAVLYLLAVVSVFVGLRYADPGWAEGRIPLVVMTLPWSVVMLGLAFAASQIPFIDHALVVTADAFNFFLFVVVSAGLNAGLIVGISTVRRWFELRTTLVATCVTVLLLVAVQVIMPRVDKDALERRHPKNVPNAAVYTGPAIGWWQLCTYDSLAQTDHCQIWNRGGDILKMTSSCRMIAGPRLLDSNYRLMLLVEIPTWSRFATAEFSFRKRERQK